LQYNLVQDGSTNSDMGDTYPTWQQARGAMYTEDAWAFIYILRDGSLPGILNQTAAVGFAEFRRNKDGQHQPQLPLRRFIQEQAPGSGLAVPQMDGRRSELPHAK